MTSLRDYRFIDRKRLDGYIEQISSTTTHDSTLGLNATLSATPKITAERQVHSREKKDHEKISEFIDYLKSCGELKDRRPALIKNSEEDLTTPAFVLEECEAVRVRIPSLDTSDEGNGVVIWVSPWPLTRDETLLRQAGLLCVIQDTTQDTSRHAAGFSHSGYTWLQTLLFQLNKQSPHTQLAKEYPLSLTGNYLYDVMGAHPHLSGEMELLRPNPLGWLESKNCFLSARSRVSMLYQIHHVGPDEIGTKNDLKDFTISTFAYGIAIWRGGAAK